MNASPATLRELFDAVLACPAAERAAFLDRHCADPALRAHLDALLCADDDGEEPLPADWIERVAEAIGEDPDRPRLPAGSRVGPFELVRVLGEGGSSTVFEARREVEGAIQRVALKLLHRGLYGPDARRRFGHEQRALLELRHPNITRMIEGGVTDAGLAYIALELVEGASITEYATAMHLGLRERLRLFAVVCRAVDAAHRALIVHRDLKPSNVLVTHEGEVKLLDFGIAKLLAEEDEANRTVVPSFTPAYAAPEQRDHGAITTATDVYALGVLLGELLTGERIRGGDARTPSIVLDATTAPDGACDPPPITGRQLRGDVDAVVLKAIEVDPARRYASAGVLADDIERLLDGRPVSAQAPTRWYRARKFVLRHRGGVAITLLFLLAVFASLGAALWQARIARVQAVRANAQTARAEAVRDFLVSVFESAEADLPREKRPSVEDLVDDAGARALRDRALADDVRADLLLSLAQVSGSLGAYEREHALLDRAIADIDRLYAPSSEPWLRARLLRARAFVAQAKPGEATALLEPLRAVFAARADALGAEALIVLANALSGANRAGEAAAAFAQAREVADRLAQARDDWRLRIDAAQAQDLVYAQKFAEGLALADATWRRWQAAGREPARELLDLQSAISLAAEQRGDGPRADAAYRDAIALAERLYARPHPDTAWVVGMYGSFLVAQAHYAEAEPYILRALQMRRALLGDAHPDTLNALAALGRLRSGQVRREEALAAFSEGVDLCRRDQVRHSVCPRLLGSRAQVLVAVNDLDGAIRNAEDAVAMQRELTGADSAQLVGALGFLARVQVKQARYAHALKTTDELLRIAGRSGGGESKDARYARFQRALALFGLGRNDEALALASAVVVEQKARTPEEKTTLFSMLMLEARALSLAGRYDDAKAAAAEALAIEKKPTPLEPAVLDGLRRLARMGRGY